MTDDGKAIFSSLDQPDRGYAVVARSQDDGSGDAIVEIYHEGVIKRSFRFPAYKVWNIAAHFSDIVDSEIDGDTHGYALAASPGI